MTERRNSSDDLTPDEQQLFETVNAIEVRTGASPSLVDAAREAGMPVERARVVMSRLTGDLGLVTEQPGDPIDDPVYTVSGRAGAAPSAGALPAREDIPGELDRHLSGMAFPASREAVLQVATRTGTPRPLRLALQLLPDGTTFLNLEEVSQAVLAEL